MIIPYRMSMKLRYVGTSHVVTVPVDQVQQWNGQDGTELSVYLLGDLMIVLPNSVLQQPDKALQLAKVVEAYQATLH